MKKGKKYQRTPAKILCRIKVKEHSIVNYSKGKSVDVVNKLFELAWYLEIPELWDLEYPIERRYILKYARASHREI